MAGRKTAARAFVAVAALLVLLMAGGCGTTINHAHDRSTDFGALKTYAWAPGSAAHSQDRLVEDNVQFLADPILAKKGFARAAGQADFVIAVRLDHYPYGNPESYELRMLSLNVYRPGSQILIWRGTASGSISTDATSGDVAAAVQGILAPFPPK